MFATMKRVIPARSSPHRASRTARFPHLATPSCCEGWAQTRTSVEYLKPSTRSDSDSSPFNNRLWCCVRFGRPVLLLEKWLVRIFFVFLHFAVCENALKEEKYEWIYLCSHPFLFSPPLPLSFSHLTPSPITQPFPHCIYHPAFTLFITLHLPFYLLSQFPSHLPSFLSLSKIENFAEWIKMVNKAFSDEIRDVQAVTAR